MSSVTLPAGYHTRATVHGIPAGASVDWACPTSYIKLTPNGHHCRVEFVPNGPTGDATVYAGLPGSSGVIYPRGDVHVGTPPAVNNDLPSSAPYLTFSLPSSP